MTPIMANAPKTAFGVLAEKWRTILPIPLAPAPSIAAPMSAPILNQRTPVARLRSALTCGPPTGGAITRIALTAHGESNAAIPTVAANNTNTGSKLCVATAKYAYAIAAAAKLAQRAHFAVGFDREFNNSIFGIPLAVRELPCASP
jgi:hypothetical protein